MKRPTLWFVVPAHGRQDLTAVCLRQLRRTCNLLASKLDIEATAIVVADDENLDTARDLGFATYERNNRFVSRRFNDGIQAACDPRWNPRPADFVVPCGSDDWVHWRLFSTLPTSRTMFAFQYMAFVREDGRELSTRKLLNTGGCGIRIYPRQVMQRIGYRPADEDRHRACDTSILNNLSTARALRLIDHRKTNPLWIVDWKTQGTQLNPYSEVAARHRGEVEGDPFAALKGHYSKVAIDEMRDLYASRVTVAA